MLISSAPGHQLDIKNPFYTEVFKKLLWYKAEVSRISSSVPANNRGFRVTIELNVSASMPSSSERLFSIRTEKSLLRTFSAIARNARMG
jgi:hypothetical protein